jgi:hypothetical protein
MAANTKKQLKKYATQIGPGAVVYKHGYKTGHLAIEGVMSFREKEVLQSLRRKALQPAPQSLAVVLSPELSEEMNIVPDWISNHVLSLEMG